MDGATDGGAVAEQEAPPTTYRPHLDGLRAIAVYLVVAFHAGSGGLAGGFIGVDVFFVLSGYLVTQLLLRDIVGNGAIRFSRFYARRFRRLLPAAFVALLATAAVFRVIATPAELNGVTGAFRAAFLYSTNWYFIHSSAGYFGADVATNPVLHFWSLAVEEQFYLVWPLALGGLFVVTRRFGERQRRTIRIVVGVVLLMSVARALSLRTSNPDWAYYGSDARAYQLLAGASIALVPSLVFPERFRRALRAASVVSIVALVFVATSWVHLDAIERGMTVAIITCALIVSIEGAGGGIVRRALSTKPLVYLGKISYGTYLWHWIVILVLLKKFDLGTNATIVVTSVVATGLASLSYQILEQPIRLSPLFDRHRITVISTGLAISVVSAVVFIPAIVDRDTTSSPALEASTVGFTKVPAGINWVGAYEQALKDGGPMPSCLRKSPTACTLVQGTGKRVVLMGDSHAWMLIPTFVEIARRDNLTLSVTVQGECPWQRGLYPAALAARGRVTSPKACALQKEDAYTRVIPALHPDLVVVTETVYERPTQPWSDAQGRRLHVTEAQLESATTASVAQLEKTGAHVLIIEPIPLSPTDPLQCLSKAKVVEACRSIAPVAPTALESFYRTLAAGQPKKVSDIDIDRLVCPFLPICDPIIGGQIVKWDQGHLTVPFAKSLAPAIEADLKQRRLLPR